MTAEELNEELQHFDYPPFIPNKESEVKKDGEQANNRADSIDNNIE